ncbi:adenosylcobinamide amidohydrolase [Sciscionella marina]|uniref:adenosylcobinamide amidohydrolase n=1 Tax=Sciscionella marina TaxID=508770 RepID=UPI0003799215|nr:adenosylcobinamide amidohydrolase [Sciscionella marina]
MRSPAEPAATEPELVVAQGFPALVWRFAEPVRLISSGPYGGGLGERAWVLNASVRAYYDGDPVGYLRTLAGELGCAGHGTALMTAVDVTGAVTVTDGPVRVTVTTGVGQPTYAAEFGGTAVTGERVGTINILGSLGVRVSDAGMINAVATATEAKTQALADAGVPGTGTCTDAVALWCGREGPEQVYGGPRSAIGAPLARAVYRAIRAGLETT